MRNCAVSTSRVKQVSLEQQTSKQTSLETCRQSAAAARSFNAISPARVLTSFGRVFGAALIFRLFFVSFTRNISAKMAQIGLRNICFRALNSSQPFRLFAVPQRCHSLTRPLAKKEEWVLFAFLRFAHLGILILIELGIVSRLRWGHL